MSLLNKYCMDVRNECTLQFAPFFLLFKLLLLAPNKVQHNKKAKGKYFSSPNNHFWSNSKTFGTMAILRFWTNVGQLNHSLSVLPDDVYTELAGEVNSFHDSIYSYIYSFGKFEQSTLLTLCLVDLLQRRMSFICIDSLQKFQKITFGLCNCEKV